MGLGELVRCRDMGTGLGEFHHHKGVEVGMNVTHLQGREKPYLGVNFERTNDVYLGIV